MLDGKIMAAVLATLAAAATAMNGGAIDASDVKTSDLSAPGPGSFDSIVPDSLLSLGERFFRNPKPTHPIKAELQVDDMGKEEFNVKNADLRLHRIKKFGFERWKVRSDRSVLFHGFSGRVDPGEPVDVAGTSKGFYTSGVNVTGTTAINQEFDTSHVEMKGVERSALDITDASGTLEFNSSTTTVKEDSRLKINSFSGDIQVFPGNGTVILDGRIARMSFGSFSFGGE